MSNEIDPLDQEDVVVIEQRDKHTLTYIAVAAVLGIAIGGLLGSFIMDSKWQSAYLHLEQTLKQELKISKETQTKVIVSKTEAVERKAADIEGEINSRVEAEVDAVTQKSKNEVDKAQLMVAELEKVNIELDLLVESYGSEIKQQNETIRQLETQISMQANIFDRSRELFQRELLIKQDLDRLQKERQALEPKLRRYKKECDVYLDGTSFDVNASSCDKRDEVNSNISQIDQMVEVNKLDLREIESISDNIGL